MRAFGFGLFPPLLVTLLLAWFVWQQYSLRQELDTLKAALESSQQAILALQRTSPGSDPSIDLRAPSPPARKSEPVLVDKNSHDFYGGKGDKPHLGGFTYVPDNKGISHNLWKFIIGELAVKSLIDLGCGMGVSSRYFLDLGVDVLCLEGSSDAIAHTRLPKDRIVQHDFTLGPWWPARTYDAVWCVEFVEHVGRHYAKNYLPVMHRAALIFVTSAGYGGYHHVEIHEKWWWRGRMTAHGFVYLDRFSEIGRNLSKVNVSREGEAEHLAFGLDIYVNPRVASLPQHQHLFGGKGCFSTVMDNRDGGVACSGVDAIPSEFESLIDCFRPMPNMPRPQIKWQEIPWSCSPNPRLKR
jgi:hypothetical protein